jgi:shikimate dehydrogenase
MTKKFGILAYPAGHSLSPALHTAAFAQAGIDATYEKFEIPPEGLADFLQKVRTEKVAGLSVSIPHKVAIIPLLDEIDDAARQIGAVNTVFWQDSKLVGTNTDWLGAIETLETVTDLADKKVVLLGGGGAARAICYGLLERGAEVTVITREAWEFAGIQKDFSVSCDLIANLNNYQSEILINATPLGMAGDLEGQSFVMSEYFEDHKPLVFDIVYNPAETKLLADAATAGCETLAGLGMLVRQGARQFTIWTGQEAPVGEMQAAAEEALHSAK